jgi:hypothetical protein
MGAMTILFLAVTEANFIGWKRAGVRFGPIRTLQIFNRSHVSVEKTFAFSSCPEK